MPPDAGYTLSQVPLDVRCENSVKNFFDTVIRPIGRLNGLINFAGIHWAGALAATTATDYENCLQLKVIGSQRVFYHAQNYLRVQPGSKLISLSSIGGGENYWTPFMAGYNVSNHALCMWNDNLMTEERLLYATGTISNPITFVAVEPQVILSTIGTYQDYIPKGNPSLNVFTDAQHVVISAFQSGVFDDLGVPADDQSFVAQGMFNILVAPQPGVRYILGNPDTTVAPSFATWPEIIQATNSHGPDAVIIDIAEDSCNS